LNDAEDLGASRLNGSLVPRGFEFTLPIEPYPYDPAKVKQLLAAAGYPNGFDAGDLYPWPPYSSMGEAIGGYLAAVGIKSRLRTMEPRSRLSLPRGSYLSNMNAPLRDQLGRRSRTRAGNQASS
jgi:peptide/nickel transport system substrate-binding protein